MGEIILRASEVPPDLAEFFEPITADRATDVFSIATEPYAGAHFAVMPTELARRCILAGTSAAGQCSACGAPWRRVTERTPVPVRPNFDGKRGNLPKSAERSAAGGDMADRAGNVAVRTLGWAPSCACNAPAVPQVVADPFTGAGTVGKVAMELDRHFQGCDLNEEYCTMARNRIAAAVPYWQDARRTPAAPDFGPLFNRQEGAA